MKTSAQKLAMVFVFFAQMVFAQDAHQQFETTFSNFTINKVLETLKIKKRYAEESAVQTLVDLNYTNFQLQLEEDLNLGLNISVSEIESRKHKFLFDLALEVDNLLGNDPKGELPDKIFNGPCVNMDFEDGNLNGWDLFVGETDGSVMYSYVNSVPALPGPNHLIVGGGVDPVVGIPRVNPDGGSFSVRLGNGTVTGAGAARMSQSFLVDATNIFYTYSYAVVFENPNGHTALERPYFTVRVYDELGANIACGEYSVYADPANASDYQAIGNVLYKDWTTVFTNLSAYIGQNVTIEFTTGDCSLGGHYAYAYLDASCSVQEITATDYDICPGQNSTLTAPAGVGSYLWSTGEITQSITINAGGIYTCLLTPPQGPSCSILLDVEIIEFPNPVASFSVDNAIGCLGTPINFTDNSTITAPSTIATYQWNFGNGIITPASSGAVIAVLNTIGTYTALSHDYAANGAFVPQLTVVSSDGCSDVFNLPISINALPVVVAGVDQTICSGDQVTLNGAGALTYSWNNGVTNGIAFTPVVGTVIYTVTGTNINGCENTDQVQVVVNPLPIVGAGINQVVCSGDQVTLSGSGASTYTWDNGITNGIAFLPAVGTVLYTVTGTDVNGCENTDQVEVIVNALPIVDAGLDKIVCQGTQVTLGGAGANTYSWNPFANDGVAFVQAVGTVIYTVTGTDLNGCKNTDQVQVTVNPLPIVTAGPDQVVCAGTSVTLTAAGAVTYTWNNGVINGIAFNPNSGTLVYTVIGTNAFSCENFDQVQVIVNPNPNTVASPDQTICNGTSITLVGAGASNYAWDNGVINGVPFTPVLGTTVYTVIGSFLTGCQSLDSVTITVNPKPIVTTFNAEICKGESVVLKGFGADTYTWTGGVIDNVAFYPMATENYFVTGTNLFNCSSSAMAKVVVHDLPIASFYMKNEHFTTTSSSSMFMNTSYDAVSYSWNFNDGSPISAEESPYHEFIADAEMEFTVQLIATTSFGCVDTAIRVIEIKEELLFYVPNTFTPDGDNLNNTFQPVFVNGFDPQGYTLYIFNRWGQIVFESHDTNVGWNGRYGVDGDFAQDGTYSWKIEVKDEHSANREMFIGHVNILR